MYFFLKIAHKCTQENKPRDKTRQTKQNQWILENARINKIIKIKNTEYTKYKRFNIRNANTVTVTISQLTYKIRRVLSSRTSEEWRLGRARQRSVLICRCFLSRDCANLIRAFRVYINPLLEYSSTVWSPSMKLILYHWRMTISRGATLIHQTITGLWWTELYEQRLWRSKVQSLEHRRLISDIVTCYNNIVHGHSSLKFSVFFKFSNSQITMNSDLMYHLHTHLLFFLLPCCQALELPTIHNSQVWIDKVFHKIIFQCRSLIFLKFPCISEFQ